MTSEASTLERCDVGTDPFPQLSDVLKDYLLVKGAELITRVGDRVQEATEKLAEQVPAGLGFPGQAGLAGAAALVEGKSKPKAAWAAISAGAKAKLHTMFGPDVDGGQKALNALKLVLAVLAAIIALILLAVLLPVVVVILLIAGSG